MNGEEALAYIHNSIRFGSRLGLERMKTLTDFLGNPQDSLRFIHVAGTNGKGSTSAYIASILSAAGLRTGLYTSPALVDFADRIRVGRNRIPYEDLGELTEKVKQQVDRMLAEGMEHPTEFELVTAIGFLYFKSEGCEVVVLETGLGGRFDATNVIRAPLAAVITTIGYDHMDRLGDTLTKIAFEKAGIIKEGCPVIVHPQEPEVMSVFEQACADRGAVLHPVDFSRLAVSNVDRTGTRFAIDGYGDFYTSLLGRHQAGNAAVAVATVEILAKAGILKIDATHMQQGIAETFWPGRLEQVNDRPLFYIDGAHNPEGAKALTDALKELFPGRKIVFIAGVLRDKDYPAMLKAVYGIASRVIATQPDSDRALPADELARHILQQGVPAEESSSICDAIEKAIRAAGPGGIVCAFGSLYYIGEVRRQVLNRRGIQ